MLTNYCIVPKSECPDIWIRLPRHKWPKSWSSVEDPVVPLERNLYGHRLAGQLWERNFEKIILKYDWEKVSNWECFFVHREKGLFLSVYVDDIKLAGKKQNINPMWKVPNKEVDLGECRSTRLLTTSPRNRSTSSSVRKAGALVPPPSCLVEGHTRVGPG